MFDVDDLEELRLLDAHFDKPGPHYRFNDSDFLVIFQQLPTDFGAKGRPVREGGPA